ncbi:MAG: DUF86 domain-containing protein [Bacteroidales bacterium]|nr:DUF86 domain-containing protein [Bacteroidales bacterium]
MDQLDKYLWDIIECIRKINRYLTLKGRRFDVFQNDTIYNDAIRWNVALIGEAMNKVLNLNPYINIRNARKMVSTRNYSIHGYDSFTDEMVWAIVIKELPILVEDIEALGFEAIL